VIAQVVYVSGPYSANPNDCTLDALHAGEDVVALGGVPLVPHLSHLWQGVLPHPWEYWLRIDLALVGRCDAVYRLPGASRGAELEVAEARRLGLPVLTSRDELAAFLGAHHTGKE